MRKRGGNERNFLLFSLIFISCSSLLLEIVQAESEQVKTEGIPTKSSEEFRNEADKLMGERKFHDAVKSYSESIKINPQEFTTYYRRSNAYQILGKNREASNDLDKVLQLKEDHHEARKRRAKLYLQQGLFSKAREDCELFLKAKPGVETVETQLKSIIEAERHQKDAENAMESSNWDSAIHSLSQLIDLAPDLGKIRMQRAELNVRLGRWNEVGDDMAKVLRMENNNIEALYLRGKSLYHTGQNEAAIGYFKKALTTDPDNKKCMVEFKKIKKLEKLMKDGENLFNEGKHSESYQIYTESLQVDPDNNNIKPGVQLMLCKNLVKMKKSKEAIEVCDLACQLDEGHVEAWANKAEAHLQLEQYQEAVDNFQKAHEKQTSNQQVRESLNNARRLLKISLRKDHYKILGVSKSASEKEIKKAGRVLAAKWHPDRNPTEEAKTKFIEINEAVEILSDETKRRRFDNGEDLDQPEQPHFHHPFGGGFPGGGGNGFNFEFNFG